jgi:hypothetical protein
MRWRRERIPATRSSKWFVIRVPAVAQAGADELGIGEALRARPIDQATALVGGVADLEAAF